MTTNIKNNYGRCLRRTMVGVVLATTVFFAVFVSAEKTFSYQLSGSLAAEGRVFLNKPLLAEQREYNSSVAFNGEFYHEWQSGSSFTVASFFRLDSDDSERTHFDFREFNFLFLADSFEMRFGVGKVFWGVTEFVHLVDIINQTDLVEAFDGEDKLGQPMVHFSAVRDWGVIDLFMLPWFRERTFVGEKGRLRPGLVVNADDSVYESAAEQHHVDFAIRYTHSVGDWDFGLAHFRGTGREPTLIPSFEGQGGPILTPYYAQIAQTSVDFQSVAGEWLWKMEGFYRNSSSGDDFFSVAGGFEYTFIGFVETGMDLGVIVEYVYDDRQSEASTPFNNDFMAGVRLVVNDAASSEVLAGIVQDTKSSARVVNIEASRRFGNSVKAVFEASFFFEQPDDDPAYSLRDDDLIRFEFFVYF